MSGVSSAVQGRALRGGALVLALLVAAPAHAQPMDMALRTAVFEGEVARAADFRGILVVCGGSAVPAASGLDLAAGCIMETGRTTAVATVNGNGAEILAEPGTQLDFLPDGIRVVLGRAFVKIRSLALLGRFNVQTRHGAASPRTTQFDVEATTTSTVFRLFEGTLQVSARDAPAARLISPGERAQVITGRPVQTRAMSRAEIEAVVRRVRETERVLERAVTVDGSYAQLRIPDLAGAGVAPSIVDFRADGSTLSWQTRNATRIELSGFGSVAASGTQSVPARNAVYTLTARNERGEVVQRSVEVRIASPPPVVEQFSADGNTLYWRTRDAERVEILGLGFVPARGSREVRPARTTTYVLVATGADGRETRRSATVRVAPPPTVDEFRWDGRMLVWRTRNAARAEIVGLGPVPLSGQRSLAPNTTTAYTLVASAADGRQARRTVTVSPPAPPPIIRTFYARGNLLVWDTAHAVTVTLSGVGAVAPRGQQQVAFGRSYQLTATNAARQSVSRTVQVPMPQIEQRPAAAPPVIRAFYAKGNLLVWETENAVTVTLSGVGAVAPRGQRQVSFGRSYQLTATNAARQSVSRTVQVPMPQIEQQAPSRGGIINRLPEIR